MRDGTHRGEHLLEELPADGMLREFGGDIQAADQAFLFLENVEGISRGGTVFESHAAGEGVGVKEAFDEFERAAVVPMQFVVPVPRFFFEERFNLADGGLSQIDDVHGWAESGSAPAAQSNHNGSKGGRGRKGGKGRNGGKGAKEGKAGKVGKRVKERNTTHLVDPPRYQ